MDTKVIGPETNCKESWDTMVYVSDAGFQGIVRLANRVFYSLAQSSEFELEREDIIQEALMTLYQNAEAWDTERSFVPWASVIFKNSMLRAMAKRKNQELTFDPQAFEQASEQDHYQSIDDKALAKDIYSQANVKTKQILDKVMDGKTLSRNEYYELDKFRTRTREKHG